SVQRQYEVENLVSLLSLLNRRSRLIRHARKPVAVAHHNLTTELFLQVLTMHGAVCLKQQRHGLPGGEPVSVLAFEELSNEQAHRPPRRFARPTHRILRPQPSHQRLRVRGRPGSVQPLKHDQWVSLFHRFPTLTRLAALNGRPGKSFGRFLPACLMYALTAGMCSARYFSGTFVRSTFPSSTTHTSW